MSEEPDFIIRSIPDNVSFRARRSWLVKNSQVFQDMFTVGREPQNEAVNDHGNNTLAQPAHDQMFSFDVPEPAIRLGLLLDLLRCPPEPVDPEPRVCAEDGHFSDVGLLPMEISAVSEGRQPQFGMGSEAGTIQARAQGPAVLNPGDPSYDGDNINVDEDDDASAEPPKIIPLPLIPQLLTLADKYALAPQIVHSIHTHILAQASINPLRVYGLATILNLPHVASAASVYLHHPPMDTYSVQEVRENIPDVEAYHLLVRLQAARRMKLVEVLMGESLFPHGYGRCEAHETAAVFGWETRKQKVALRIHAGTNVASEMWDIMQAFERCSICSKAGIAALEMLAFKCNRCLKRIDQLPQ